MDPVEVAKAILGRLLIGTAVAGAALFGLGVLVGWLIS